MTVRTRPLPRWPRLDELDVPTGKPFLIDGLLHKTCTTIFGRPGVGKGWVAQSAAWALMNSQSWFGREVLAPGDVAFWPLDPGQGPELKSRAIHLGGTRPIIPAVRPDLTIEGFCDFAEDLAEYGARVLFVDNLFRLLRPDWSIRNDEHVRVVLDKLDRVIQRDISVVLIHHAGKPGETGTPKTPIGSTAIEAWSRHFLRVGEGKGGSLTITSYGNDVAEFTINTKLDPNEVGDTPFFVDSQEISSRSQSRIDEGLVIARHMMGEGSFSSVSAAATWLVTSPPEGFDKTQSAWRTLLDRKVVGAGLFEKGTDGRSIHPNTERLR